MLIWISSGYISDSFYLYNTTLLILLDKKRWIKVDECIHMMHWEVCCSK